MKNHLTAFWLGAALLFWQVPLALANPIGDPLLDYLAMEVPLRVEFVDGLESIRKVLVDVDGDGKNEVFLGVWYKQSGSKTAYYWTGYKEVAGGGYQRITPATSDVLIPSFEDIFIGDMGGASPQGLVSAIGVVSDNTDDRNVISIEELHRYSIVNGALVDENAGPLDLSDEAERATYERYFGKNRQSRSAIIETITKEQLQALGYTIPAWEVPP